MNVELTPELEAFVQAAITSGAYRSTDDVVHAGLWLLRRRDEIRQAHADALRGDIVAARAQLERGEGASGPKVFAEFRSRRQHASRGKRADVAAESVPSDRDEVSSAESEAGARPGSAFSTSPLYGDFPHLFWDLASDAPVDASNDVVLARLLVHGHIEDLHRTDALRFAPARLPFLEMPEYIRRFWQNFFAEFPPE